MHHTVLVDAETGNYVTDLAAAAAAVAVVSDGSVLATAAVDLSTADTDNTRDSPRG